MDCKEFERLIPDFIGRKLDFLTLKRFHTHMETCENCKEELEIQFLVSEGIQRLEEGDAFDLQKELDQRLIETKRKVRFHDAFLRVGLGLELAAAVAVAGVVVWILW
ncbi:MAG: zf-HC2 domain-containing protein [Candidatus Gastranaerophilales bacterium]|nr:zf-HC2 domain-containing protein [Candidatus Gastranaerophilales bacterium]